MQKTEPVEVNLLPCFKPTVATAEEQIVFQVELGGQIKSEFLPAPENIIQHIPVTYVSTNSSNLAQEPVTYFLSNPMPDTGGYCTMTGRETQKIILVQDSNPSTNLYETRDRMKENVEDCGFPGVWNVVPYGAKPEMKSPLLTKPKAELEVKPEKKVSVRKNPSTKRINSKLKTANRKVSKAKKMKEESEKGKWIKEEEKCKKNLFELTKLEHNVDQVAERLKFGCDCSDSNCFDGLSADDVFKHRLNIADLTKAEHDMYLMGVIMTSIHNLEETCRHKERLRIRSCYVYQGKKVCLTAFLYLQHVTLYQMKRLRSHLKNHGVSPRIHGNRGRKPANTFSLEIYRRAANFVQKYIEKHCVKTMTNFKKYQSGKTICKKDNRVKIPNKMTSYHLPAECTKRILHKEYKTFCDNLKPSQKVMKYSTFTNFLKKQFPYLKFHKKEEKRQERRATTEEERWRSNKGTEENERKLNKEEFGKAMDKSIQVDKDSAGECIPKPQVLINGQRLDIYQESLEDGFGISHQVLVGSTETYTQTLTTNEYYSV